MKDMIVCDECDALNPEGATFCLECGMKLVAPRAEPAAGDGADESPGDAAAAGTTDSAATDSGALDSAAVDDAAPWPEPRSRRKAAAGRRQKGTGDAVERSRARHEFGRIKNIVLTVRSVYWAGVVFAVVQLLLHYVILIDLMADSADGFAQLMAVILWGQFGLMVAGALLVVRAPLVWTAVGACYWTLNTVQMLWLCAQTDWLLLEDARAMAFLTMVVFMAVSFWFAVAQAARVQRLMKQNPDLQLVRKKLDATEKVVGGVADDAHQRRLAIKHRELLSKLRMAGIVIVGMVVVGVVIWVASQPAGVGETVDKFRERLAAADTDRLGDLFADGRHSRNADRLRKALGQRGWLDSMPQLGQSQIEERENSAVLRLACEQHEIEARFRRQPVGWRLVSVELPPLVTGDIGPAILAFQKAWRSLGTDELTAMLRPESRDRVGKMLVRVLEKREWHEQRPKLGDVDPGSPGKPRVRVLFEYGFDEIGVVFEYWHPRWWMSSIRLPSK